MKASNRDAREIADPDPRGIQRGQHDHEQNHDEEEALKTVRRNRPKICWHDTLRSEGRRAAEDYTHGPPRFNANYFAMRLPSRRRPRCRVED